MKLGCDPEIFLADAAGALVSAIDKIGGSKHCPRPLPIGEGYAVQEDNVAIEFNIPPADSKETFINSINAAKEYLSSEIAAMGLVFNTQSAASFPMMELAHPMAHVFGCDPDFNAWKDGKENKKPMSADKTLRSAGGHVHIGHKFDDPDDLIKFIKFMDLCLGVPSVLMDNGELRKQLYGKAGAFRFKPYGGEYRTLSNFWIFDNKLTSWVWDATQQAMEYWQQDKVDIDGIGRFIQKAINSNNKTLASVLVDKHNLLMV